MNKTHVDTPVFTRRSLLKAVLATGGTAALLRKGAFGQFFTFFEPLDVENPILSYLNRDWEKTYREKKASTTRKQQRRSPISLSLSGQTP